MARQRKKKGRPVSGWILLDKPSDMTSTQAVGKIKYLFNAQKAGHAGTLDPLATGMLPIALGEATKTVPYAQDGEKTYQFTVIWGVERSTDDLEGEVTSSSDQRPAREQVEALLAKYTGEIEQVPPQFSAIKLDGKRAYDMAREGESFEIPSRRTVIYSLNITAMETDDETSFEVRCGKGTYVRALARDMGRDLGCFGSIKSLRRTVVAPFAETDMVLLDELESAREGCDQSDFSQIDPLMAPVASALEGLPCLTIDEEFARRLRLGNAIVAAGRNAPIAAEEACAVCRGRLVAIGSIEQGRFQPRRIFNDRS